MICFSKFSLLSLLKLTGADIMSKKRADFIDDINSITGYAIAYRPEMSEIAGSIKAGLLLSQLIYWQSVKGEGVAFYKSQRELQKETGLSIAEHSTAKNQLKSKKIITVKVYGLPPTTHYTVNIELVIKLLRKKTQDNSAEPNDTYSDNKSEQSPTFPPPTDNTDSLPPTTHTPYEPHPDVKKVFDAYLSQGKARNPGALLTSLIEKHEEGRLITIDDVKLSSDTPHTDPSRNELLSQRNAIISFLECTSNESHRQALIEDLERIDNELNK